MDQYVKRILYVSFLYPSKCQRFSDIFREYGNGRLAERDQEPVNTCSELEIKSARILCGTQHKKCKDFFSKYGQICKFLRLWLHLLKKSLMEIKKLIEGIPSTKPPSAKA